MSRIRYQVAVSLDGFIAGPNDEYDWIPMDPDIDFGALYAEFDTFVMGRKTFEVTGGHSAPGTKTIVFSRTLRPQDHPGVTILSDLSAETIARIRREAAKDIWLYGGGELFARFLELGCVDTVEPAVIPILLGSGRPFLPSPAVRRRLSLTEHRHYSKSGIMLLKYDVLADSEPS